MEVGTSEIITLVEQFLKENGLHQTYKTLEAESGVKYNVIEIFTSEEVHWKGRPLHLAIIEEVRTAKIAARTIVLKGVAGSYENGEIASSTLEILSFNMPLKIEIILPAAELNTILPKIEEMVTNISKLYVKTIKNYHKFIFNQYDLSKDKLEHRLNYLKDEFVRAEIEEEGILGKGCFLEIGF